MSAPAAITPTAATSIPRDFGAAGGICGGGVWVFLEGFDISEAFYRDRGMTLKFSRHLAYLTGTAISPSRKALLGPRGDGLWRYYGYSIVRRSIRWRAPAASRAPASPGCVKALGTSDSNNPSSADESYEEQHD